MFSSFERMVAMRYLRARRQEGFISIIAWFSLLGIALGVATLIIVMSVMNGFRAELLGRILGLNGHFAVQAQQGPLPDFDSIAERVRAVPGVLAVRPQVEGQVMVSANNAASGALVRGMRVEDLARHTTLVQGVKAGKIADLADESSVMIGSRMAARLGLGVGNPITLISPRGSVTAFGTVPRAKAYNVAAVFEIGMYEYDNNFIYMGLEQAQLFFRVPNAVTSLEVMVADPDQVRATTARIAGAVGPGGRIYDWQHANASFFTAIQVERNVMFLILTLIILVAAFNIISSLIMLVKDKGRDIAILRTMGATRGMVMRVFFLAGASVGTVGTIGGFLLGILFCANIEHIRQFLQSLTGTELFSAEIYFLSRLPAKVDPAEVALVVAMALGLSFLATIYPAWRAARLDPVEALRYE
ncbi:MAG: lipoprotein-releasing ABC transporter permease subunit [Alphaproteobacteria bacterium]|nr:lipoprotein-releasing ABC transporter permease subunit [Alphaproteobacteria bacterium]